MSKDRWQEVKKSNPCPACGKAGWCAWTPDGAMLKCERTTDAPPGMVLVKPQDGGGLFRRDDEANGSRVPIHKSPPAKPKSEQVKGQIVKTYDYKDADGVLLYQKVRYEPKDFRLRRPDGQGHWVWGLRAGEYAQGKDGDWYLPNERTPDDATRRHFPDTAQVLYRLSELLAADKNAWVFVVEGEKDSDNLVALGLVATTNPGGAGKWKHLADDAALHGRRVAILWDKDKPNNKWVVKGWEHAQDVALRLHGNAAVVKVIDLPDGEVDGRPVKDVSDWIEWLDGKTGEEPAAALLSMADAAQDWAPPLAVSTSTPMPKKVEPYRPFPVGCLPEPMRSFVAQAADAIGCDAAFVALPLLAASASAIGNTRRIELNRDWTEPAILWACIVGDSGTMKSPALELALRPLRRRQHEAIKQHAQEMETHKDHVLRYEIDLAAWKKSGGQGQPPAEPQSPVLPRCWCDDTTIEALSVLLLQNWRGLLMVRDELAGWLGGFDRYAQGKGGDVPKWLEMHGGRSIMVDRKTGNTRTIYVPRAAVSVTGGIQPATLERALGREYFENGLAARLLLACPPRRVRQWTEAEIDPTTEKAIAMMFDRLYSLEPDLGQDGEPDPGIVRLSPAAKSAWISFYNEHAQEHVDLTGDLSAAWSKLEGYAARLALVVHFVRWAANDPSLTDVGVVDETSIAAGVALSRWFGQETRRVYAILGETEADRQHRGLVELVQRHGGSVTVRDLMRSCRAYPTSEIAEQTLAGLVQAGVGRWEDAGPTAQGGRPTRRFVLADTVDVDITPKTLEMPGVSSTEPIKASIPPLPAPGAYLPPRVDTTPELPKESEVSSTSTVSTPATPQRTVALDPDRPGPIDLLTHSQCDRYKATYYSRPAGTSPEERHRIAWRAALRQIA